MSVFGTSAIDLSMCGSDGQQLTANVYLLEGVQNANGTLREMSIGQLVMAICLSRATELEQRIVGRMEELAGTTAVLEALTNVDAQLVEEGKYTNVNYPTPLIVTREDGSQVSVSSSDELLTAFQIATVDDKGAAVDVSTVITNVESKMDSLNSVSQTTLIDIQSLTSKRDDTYSLVSNVLKSLNTVLIGNVNNL